MTQISDKYIEIYRLYRSGLSVNQIVRRDIPDDVSFKTVRNIIYRLRNHPDATACPRDQAIYQLYLDALSEGADSRHAIRYAYHHQPPVRVSKRTVQEALIQVRRERRRQGGGDDDEE